jgi:transposase
LAGSRLASEAPLNGGSFGTVARVGAKGTGAYGAGLSRFPRREGVDVIEVDCPKRQARRQHGRSDPADPIEAARAAHNGRARGLAKSRDGNAEAIQALLVAKSAARAVRIK